MGGGGEAGAREAEKREGKALKKVEKRRCKGGWFRGFRQRAKAGKREGRRRVGRARGLRGLRGLRRRARGRRHRRAPAATRRRRGVARRRLQPPTRPVRRFERFARRLGEERGSARAVRVAGPGPRGRAAARAALDSVLESRACSAYAAARYGLGGVVGAHVAQWAALNPDRPYPPEAEALRDSKRRALVSVVRGRVAETRVTSRTQDERVGDVDAEAARILDQRAKAATDFALARRGFHRGASSRSEGLGSDDGEEKKFFFGEEKEGVFGQGRVAGAHDVAANRERVERRVEARLAMRRAALRDAGLREDDPAAEEALAALVAAGRLDAEATRTEAGETRARRVVGPPPSAAPPPRSSAWLAPAATPPSRSSRRRERSRSRPGPRARRWRRSGHAPRRGRGAARQARDAEPRGESPTRGARRGKNRSTVKKVSPPRPRALLRVGTPRPERRRRRRRGVPATRAASPRGRVPRPPRPLEGARDRRRRPSRRAPRRAPRRRHRAQPPVRVAAEAGAAEGGGRLPPGPGAGTERRGDRARGRAEGGEEGGEGAKEGGREPEVFRRGEAFRRPAETTRAEKREGDDGERKVVRDSAGRLWTM